MTFDEVYASTHRIIFSFVMKHISNHQDVEDITAMTYEHAWAAWGEYEEKGHSIRSWLFKIAYNIIIDHYRRRYNNIPRVSIEFFTENERMISIEDGYGLIELQEEVDEMWKVLSEELPCDQELIYNKYILGCEYGRDTNKLRQRVHRSLKRMAVKLSHLREVKRKTTR